MPIRDLYANLGLAIHCRFCILIVQARYERVKVNDRPGNEFNVTLSKRGETQPLVASSKPMIVG